MIRAAGLAGKVLLDHGEKCPRCGGRMELASAPTKNSMPPRAKIKSH
jgi:rRNA maturation protein Nop10